ncbi:MAG: contractile injection system protein, VgrG/Pvc8 family [Caldilineaceae bacterium]
MKHEQCVIEIEGEEASDLYADLSDLAVELDDELAAQFRLRLALDREQTGVWRYLDDERLAVWRQVTISAGFDDGVEELIDGYITHLRPAFDPNPVGCTLEIWGMDRSVLLDRQEKLKAWPNKKDSDIAREIFRHPYALTPAVEDTVVVHDEAISTMIQRESDMHFLRRLAARNGFDCYVEGTTGYFRAPQLTAAPQPVLAVHFGDETNVEWLTFEVDALLPANVTMQQIDRLGKDVQSVSVTASRQPALGEIAAADLLATGIDPGQIVIGQTAATGLPEMTALCQGLYQQATWFLTGEGEIQGNRYGHALKPRRTVTIKGVGERYSGVYYVSHVTHTFGEDGYRQHFRVKRNALMPSGTENFAATPDE